MTRKTRRLIEEQIQRNLDEIECYKDMTDDDRDKLVTETCKLLDKLTDSDKVESENNRFEKSETNKFIQKFMEIGTTTAVAGLGWLMYFKAQTKLLEFEQTGAIRSTATRELHLPKLPKIF